MSAKRWSISPGASAHARSISASSNAHRETGTAGTPPSANDVLRWIEGTDYDAAVWTDLERNYEDELGHSFSPEAAIAYLRTLPPDSLIEAHRYIESAPVNVDTPLRAALRRQEWWQAVRY